MTVLKIGGSILFDKTGKLNKDKIKEIVHLIESRSDINGLVVGGGSIARDFIGLGESFSLDDEKLDWLGINATHINAKMFEKVLDEFSFYEDVEYVSSNPVIMGGTKPGHTTDAVSLMLADKLQTDTVYAASDIDGVYDTRNNTLENAQKLEYTDVNTIMDIIKQTSDQPGRNTPIDREAVQLIKNRKLRFRLFDGRDITNIESALNGDDIGTIIEV